MSTFAEDTAITRVDEFTFGADVAPGYGVIEGAPNGGYLMVPASRAMAATVDRPDPVTVTAHFLQPPSEGPFTIHTEVVRAGGRHRTAGARVMQDGRECVRLIGTYTDLSRAEGVTDVRWEPPSRPHWESLPLLNDLTAREGGYTPPPIFQRLQHRVDPSVWGWALGKADGTGLMHSWCRLADDEELDSHGLLFIADALPPAIFNLGTPVGWVPTIELTVHVRRRPTRGWINAEFSTAAVTDGYCEEDGRLWNEAGELLAISRQSALAARPR